MSFQYTKIKKDWKYQTYSAYIIQTPIKVEKQIITSHIVLSEDGKLCINQNYCWDGPSGPAIDTQNFMRPSCVHDALYQLMRMGLIPESWKKTADDILYELFLEDSIKPNPDNKFWVNALNKFNETRAKYIRWAVGTWVAKRACAVNPQEDVETIYTV